MLFFEVLAEIKIANELLLGRQCYKIVSLGNAEYLDYPKDFEVLQNDCLRVSLILFVFVSVLDELFNIFQNLSIFGKMLRLKFWGEILSSVFPLKF